MQQRRYPSAQRRPEPRGLKYNFLRHFAVGAGCIHHYKDLIAVGNCADGGKSHAYAGDGAGNNQRIAPGVFTALTKSSLCQALISPLRAQHISHAAHWREFQGSKGHLGLAAQAVVITGILANEAIFAKVRRAWRSSGIGISPTV